MSLCKTAVARRAHATHEDLFGLLVSNVLLAPFTELAHLEPVLERLLVLPGMIVDALAVPAFHLDEIVL
jgi:hypothetical protein